MNAQAQKVDTDREVVIGGYNDNASATRKKTPFEMLYKNNNFEQHQFDAGIWVMNILKHGERSEGVGSMNPDERGPRLHVDGKSDFVLDCIDGRRRALSTLRDMHPHERMIYMEIVIAEKTLKHTIINMFGYKDAGTNKKAKTLLGSALDALAEEFHFKPQNEGIIRTSCY